MSLIVLDGNKVSLDTISFNDTHNAIVFQGLSNLCRYANTSLKTVIQPFTLLEHSVAMAETALGSRCSPETVRMMLWHNAAAAYVGAIPASIRKISTQLQDIEDRVATQIFDHQCLPPLGDPQWVTVKKYDRMSLVAEVIIQHGIPYTDSNINDVANVWTDVGYFTTTHDMAVFKKMYNILIDIAHERDHTSNDPHRSMINRACDIDVMMDGHIKNGTFVTTYLFSGRKFYVVSNKDGMITDINLKG